MGIYVSPRTSVVCGLIVAASSFLGGGAYAADLSLKDTTVPSYYYSGEDLWTRSSMFGDWGGLKSRAAAAGITLSAGMVEEALGNLSGGTRNAFGQAGQLDFKAAFDMNKLAGLQGGTFVAHFVQRWGINQAENAGIPELQLTNEVFGRGDILRLPEFYYQQKLFGDTVEVKGGRLAVGSDFFYQDCAFVNLGLCGGQPGNIVGSYIYNWPVSQWGGVVKVNLPENFALRVGVYDMNPNYLSTNESIAALPTFPSFSNPAGTPMRSTGTMEVAELEWKPALFGLKPSDYRVGGWTGDASMLRVNSATATVSSESGVYFSLVQPLTSGGGYKDADPKAGLSAFLNASFADEKTSGQDRQISGGLIQHGTLNWRPNDEIGFGVAATHVNSAALGNVNAGGWETAVEAWYGWQATGWLNIKLDAQWLSFDYPTTSTTANSGAFLLGARTSINF
jgi:porin